MGALAVLGYVAVLIFIGLFPVIRKMTSSKQSPWVSQDVEYKSWEQYGESSFKNENIQEETFDEIVGVSMLEQFEEPKVQELHSDEFTHSIPTDDMLVTIDQLVTSISNENDLSQYFQFDRDIEGFQFENEMRFTEITLDSVLSKSEYQAIEKKYTKEVADMITATPDCIQGNGHQVMIGRLKIVNDTNMLSWKDSHIQLVGKVPEYENQVYLIHGHLVTEEVFHVLSWEEPEMAIHYGVTWNQELLQVQ